MRRIVLLFLILIICFSCRKHQKNDSSYSYLANDTLVILKNKSISLTICRYGGAITEFVFNDHILNPFTWKVPVSEMPENNQKGAPFQGHFMCIGRWGSPSEGEIEAGIPHNGEPANNWWKADTGSSQSSVEMYASAPLEGLNVYRRVELSPSQACFIVEEKLVNIQKSGRFTAIVQHATFGTPFIDEKIVINSNASHGFNQFLIAKSLTEFEYKWPFGFSDSLKTPLDLRMSDNQKSFVSTHVIDDEYGWATATNPKNGLMIGYLWKTTEYPWLHIWQGMRDGKLWAKAIEFGTTGLGDTYSPESRVTTTFHGRSNNQYIDAGDTLTKRYFCFLIKIPEGYSETKSVAYRNDRVEVIYLVDNKEVLVTFNFIIW